MKRTKPTVQKRVPAESVDDYLAVLPEDARAALEKLRKTIKATAPKATEVISYQIRPTNTTGSWWASRPLGITAPSTS